MLAYPICLHSMANKWSEFAKLNDRFRRINLLFFDACLRTV
jgi:hypothetical protein